MRIRTRSQLLLLAAALLFSTGGAAIKAAAFSPWQVAAFRSAVAVVAILALVPGARRGWTWRVLPVGATYAATLVLFVLATKLTTAANAIFLQSTAPLYVLLLSPLLLKEHVKRADLLFACVLGLGLALFFVSRQTAVASAPDPIRGNILAAASGLTWALTLLGFRRMEKHGANGGSALASVVTGNFLAAMAAFPFALPVASVRAVDWMLVVYLGVFQIGLAYLCLTAAIRYVPAFEATTLLLVEPAFNPVWAFLVHGERPASWALAGGVLILGATFIHTWRESRSTFGTAA